MANPSVAIEEVYEVGSGQTVRIIFNKKFKFVLAEAETATVQIRNKSYVVSVDSSRFVWDQGGAGVHTFLSIAGSEDETIIRIETDFKFSVIWEGNGSHLVDINIFTNTEIDKNNFIVIYQLGNSDSREAAEYYANKHNLLITNHIGTEDGGSGLWEIDGQLVGINCSSNEILNNKDEFEVEMVIPLQDAMENSLTLQNFDIWGVVLSYNVPGGFYHPDIREQFDPSENPSATEKQIDIISSTSRLATALSKDESSSFQRLNKKVNNKLFNRSIFSRFSQDDAKKSLIVSRIDAPTLSITKTFIDNADKINKQGNVTGKFYLDPYSDRNGPTADAYTKKLTDFRDGLLTKLGLDIFKTSFIDPYIDPTIPYVENDSFVWQWFADRATNDFFRKTPSIRTFFFSADNDSAESLRNEKASTWTYLAFRGGYSCVAGAMSKAGNDAYLDPRPFFEALFKGATIGEAYLFSLPYLDWTISLFGDPLSTVAFPGILKQKEITESVLDEHQTWLSLSNNLSRIAAHLLRKEEEINEIREEIVNTNVQSIEINVLIPSDKLFKQHDKLTREAELRDITDRIFSYPTRRFRISGLDIKFPTLNEYLTEKGFKVSQLLLNMASGITISSSNIYEEGFWEFEFVVNKDVTDFINYHFILDVSASSNLENTSDFILTKDSSDIINWTYESEKDVFLSMPIEGVPTSQVGRRIRYARRKDTLLSIDESLTRGITYYFRVTQYNAVTEEKFTPRDFSDIIYT